MAKARPRFKRSLRLAMRHSSAAGAPSPLKRLAKKLASRFLAPRLTLGRLMARRSSKAKPVSMSLPKQTVLPMEFASAFLPPKPAETRPTQQTKIAQARFKLRRAARVSARTRVFRAFALRQMAASPRPL